LYYFFCDSDPQSQSESNLIQNSTPQEPPHPQSPDVPLPPPEIIEDKPQDMLQKDRQSSFSVKLNNKRKPIDFGQPNEKKLRHDY